MSIKQAYELLENKQMTVTTSLLAWVADVPDDQAQRYILFHHSPLALN